MRTVGMGTQTKSDAYKVLQQEIVELKAENAALQQEIAELKAKKSPKKEKAAVEAVTE